MWEGSWACIELLRSPDSWMTSALRDHKVLELGSGIGLLGLCAAAVGAHVLVTDVPAVVETTLRANIEANATDSDAVVANPVAWSGSLPVGDGSIVAQPLNWLADLTDQTSPNDPRDADVLLAAECVWLQDLVDPFVATVASLLRVCPARHTTLTVAFLPLCALTIYLVRVIVFCADNRPIF